MNRYDDEYDLFRRAIQQRDAGAWAVIALRYRRLLIVWAAHCQAARESMEAYEDLADEALARAWAALSPQRFDTFPSLSALLAYLRACVIATAIDAVRARVNHERSIQHVEQVSSISMEQTVIERLDRAELWRVITDLIKTETERVVLVERFVYGLPPRDILAQHPDLFPNVTMIYGAIQNLCERLQRNPALRRWYDERRAA